MIDLNAFPIYFFLTSGFPDSFWISGKVQITYQWYSNMHTYVYEGFFIEWPADFAIPSSFPTDFPQHCAHFYLQFTIIANIFCMISVIGVSLYRFYGINYFFLSTIPVTTAVLHLIAFLI